MHVTARKRLNEFAEKYSETNNALADWHHLMKQNNFDMSYAVERTIFAEARTK
jgi:mRNA interferase HigB